MSTPPAELLAQLVIGSGAKSSGIVMRLRQFDALHHSLPATAMLGTEPPPADVQAFSAAVALSPVGRSTEGRPAAATSHEMPSTGTATSEHGTVGLHPRDAFVNEFQTTNLACPEPSAPV